MGAKYKTVKRSWLNEDQARAFVAAAKAGQTVRFEGRCWEFADTDGTLSGAITVFRLRQLPEEACSDTP